MATVIKRFAKNGKTLVVPQRSTPVTVTETAKLIRARLNPDEGIGGAGVRITNPGYTRKRNGRTASLGMGNVGQRGRIRDF